MDTGMYVIKGMEGVNAVVQGQVRYEDRVTEWSGCGGRCTVYFGTTSLAAAAPHYASFYVKVVQGGKASIVMDAAATTALLILVRTGKTERGLHIFRKNKCGFKKDTLPQSIQLPFET